MRAKILKAIAVVVVLIGGLGLSATLLDTTERPADFDPPGYLQTEMTVPGRSIPVPLHIWYPTDATTPSTLVGQNGLFYGAHVRPATPPKPGLAAVVLLSHGSGGNAERLGWLAGYLAHRGMIVVAPNHPGTTSGDSDPFQTPLIWERTDDLSAALDLLQAAPPGGLQTDLARVAVIGFSLGGYTALRLGGVRVTKAAFIAHCSADPQAADCTWMVAAGVDFTAIDAALYDASHADPRVGAVVAIDPALVNAVESGGLAEATDPFLLINLGEKATLPPGMDLSALSSTLPRSTQIYVPGAKHFSFLAECSTLGKIIIGIAGEDNICSDAGLRDRQVIHTELRTATGDFLAGQFGLAG